MRHHPARINAKKRDGLELSLDEIRDVVAGVVDGSMGDAQLGAFLMAVCCRGMTVAETTALTLAMRDSGRVLDLSALPGPKVDKHSTGGVGDKVSLLLAPLVAAAGVWVPMISGRGLGHTGGTIDKLHAIPGYRTNLSTAEFEAVLAGCGFVMAAASAEIAPADRRMYAIRDVTGTVESVPLITASILSKKLAEGIDGLVMDVKCGRAAFMKTRDQAAELTESLVRTGGEAGKRVTALVTDMDTPLGRAVGNALEVREIVECLRGEGPRDLLEITFALGAEMLVLAGVDPESGAARRRLEKLLRDGSAERVLRRNVELQGGDPSFLDDPDRLGRAPVTLDLRAPHSGWVADVDPLALGSCAMELGAGRRQPDDPIDPLVGVVLEAQLGDQVEAGQTLAVVHAADEEAAWRAIDRLGGAIVVGDRPVSRGPLVLARRGAP